MRASVIIPAAGQGRRFGAIKQFQLLHGKPLLLYPLEIFEQSPSIQEIVLVIPLEQRQFAEELVRKNGLKKVKQIIPGGKERQDSVRKGFEVLAPCDFILVHDAVRPFITLELIGRMLEEASNHGGCIPGLPVKETLKKLSSDHLVEQTIDRSVIWSIQTPQVFRYDLFQSALKKAEEDAFLGTDESMLVERTGTRVKVIEGILENIKITTPADLVMAEAIIESRKKQ